MRVEAAEEVLLGSDLGDEAIEEAAQVAAREVEPASDVHGSAEYRSGSRRCCCAARSGGRSRMGAEFSANGRWVGQSIRPVEFRRHVTGTGSFVDDLQRPGLRYLAFVRSQHPAARIASLDTEDARAVDGVEAVMTAADLDDLAPLMPMLARDEFVAVEMPLLARERVRFAGEPVAMVVARTPHAAEDGAEQVRVDYEEGDAVASLEAAIADGAPLVHDDAPGNLLLDVQYADDDVEPDFERAAAVVEASFRTGRVTAVPMEGRACLAEWDRREDRALLYTSTQVPHIVRTAVAGILGLPERRVRVVAPDVGGGFGQKCVVAREEALTLVAARAVGHPVKWTEDRQENLPAGFQGHEQRYDVRAAFDADGRILALDADILCDVGAYSSHPFTCGVEPLMAATELFAAYRGERYRARTRAVATNKSPMAPYRGVSRPQIVLVMERLLEKAARELDARSRRDPPPQPDPGRRLPAAPRRRASSSTRAPTSSRSTAARSASATTSSASASAAPATRAACSASASAASPSAPATAARRSPSAR